MKKRRWLLIVAVVAAAHVVFFALAGSIRPLPRAKYVPSPNFVAKELTTVNAATGERTVYREFTVSTRLAPDGKPHTAQ